MDPLERIRARDRELAEQRKSLGIEDSSASSLSQTLNKIFSEVNAETPEEREQRTERQREADDATLRRKTADAVQQRKAAIEAALRVVPQILRVRLLGAELDDTEASKVAHQWFVGDKQVRVLLLRGGVGVGKSMAAAIVVRESAMSYKRSVSWHRPNDFVSAVMHGYDENSPKLGADLVVVDDVGRETKQDFGEALCAFLDDFSTRLVLTTNLTKEEFRARYDLRVVDRLGEIGAAITVKGGSRRKNVGGF